MDWTQNEVNLSNMKLKGGYVSQKYEYFGGEQGWKKLTCAGIYINDISRDIQGEKKEFGSKFESIQEACTKTDLDYSLLVRNARKCFMLVWVLVI